MALSEETIAKIGAILKKRPDLILLTDDVYGTFVPGFRSLMGAFPYNTIGVYSYSKYFGCTGWRLGVIAVHENNLFDDLIARHPEPVQKKLDKRYGGADAGAAKIEFIDRIVADSRDVALNHTAGLSLPQQVMMSLFSLYELMDEKKDYQKACIGIVKKRVDATLEGLGIKVDPNPLFDYYYGLIDLEFWLTKYVGEEFVAWIRKNVHPLDIVFRLAEDYGIVLLNGGGFEAPTGPCGCPSPTSTITSTTTSAGRCVPSPAATCRPTRPRRRRRPRVARRSEGVAGTEQGKEEGRHRKAR